MDLPNWALRNEEGVIEIDSDAAYGALFEDYRALYQDSAPDFMSGADWEECREQLFADAPSAYWLECVHQAIKLDVIASAGTMKLALHISAAQDGRYAQRNAPVDGWPASRAAGKHRGADGVARRSMDARRHYARLRGFIPNPVTG